MADPGKPPARMRRLRLTVLAAIACVLGALWVLMQRDTAVLEAELRDAARAAGYVAQGDSDQSTALDVTVTRKWLLTGPVTGKVALYTRKMGAGAAPVLVEHDFFFERRDGEWVLTESGQCSDGACTLRAQEAFEREEE